MKQKLDILIVGFYTPSLASDTSTVEIPWKGGALHIDCRLDVGGFVDAVTAENAPRGEIWHVRASNGAITILFDARTESTSVSAFTATLPKGSLHFKSSAPAPGAFGELRAVLSKV